MAAPNLILQTEQVEDYVRKGAPDGTEPLGRAVPVLLARIQELERALIPFARVAARGNPQNLPLVQVYFKDCESAKLKLSRAAALAVMPQPSEMAAE
jgi:hypothetical protein